MQPAAQPGSSCPLVWGRRSRAPRALAAAPPAGIVNVAAIKCDLFCLWRIPSRRRIACIMWPSSWPSRAVPRSLAWRWPATLWTPTRRRCGRQRSQVGTQCVCKSVTGCRLGVGRSTALAVQGAASPVNAWRTPGPADAAAVEMMPWRRLEVGGQPHDHAFMWQGSEASAGGRRKLAGRAACLAHTTSRPAAAPAT